METRLPLPSPVKQIDGLQILRFVAVLLVIWLHSSQRIAADGGHALPNLGVFGIDIFFVISGFIISMVATRSTLPAGPAAAGNFLVRRLIRIYPLYWVLFLASAIRMFHANPLAGRRFLPNFFLLPFINYPVSGILMGISWTLIFEMFFYAVLSFVLLFTARRSTYGVLTILSLFVLYGCFFDIRHPGLIVFCNPLLLEFLFGCIIALLYYRRGGHRLLGVAMLITGGVLAICFQAFGPKSATGLQMALANRLVFTRVFTWGVGAALIVGGMIFWSPATKSRTARLAVLLGNASYSTYLISSLDQEFIGRLVASFARTKVYTSLPAAIAVNVVILALSLGVGLVVYFTIERPLLHYLNATLLPGLSRRRHWQRPGLSRPERPALETGM